MSAAGSGRRRPIVWVLVHDLGRSGVPICLARLLAWTSTQPDAPELHVVAGRTGPLADGVRASVASLTTLEPEAGRSTAATIRAAAAEAGIERAGALVRDRAVQRRVSSLPRPDVVLLHGAGAWPLLRSIERVVGSARVVLHLHELALGIERSIPAGELDAAMARPDLVASVCEPDARTAALLGSRTPDVVVVPGCIDAAAVPQILGAVDLDAPPPARSELVAVGEAGWRKGTDRFVALAHELVRRRPAARARWIGAPPAPGWRQAIESEVPVEWPGELALPWAAVGDAVVVVPSREDPLPLVVLEAALRRLPVVAAATGGLPALLGDGRGWCVDGDDLRGLVHATLEAMGEQDGAEGGARAAALDDHVRRHHDVGAVGPRWLAAVLGR